MIALIVAYSKNRVIGYKGHMPWNLKNELNRFKALTTNQVVIMGRRTYESIGHPLPNRLNIVLSHTQNFDSENCITAHSLQDALALAKMHAPDKDIYISGGESVYKEALPLVHTMYITLIDAYIEGDTFFPSFCEEDFTKQIDGIFHEELTYTYMTYTRK